MSLTGKEIAQMHFMKINKREMDYLILGNVQVVRGMRKGKKQGDIVQGNVVNPKKLQLLIIISLKYIKNDHSNSNIAVVIILPSSRKNVG